MAHARLSPSAAARWTECTASVRAIERARAEGVIGPDVSSPEADEGTAAHQVREDCLKLGLDAYDFIGTSILVNGKAWPVTREMAEALQPGIDWIRERCPDESKMLVEHQVALEPWLPGQFGTIDCAFWREVTVHGDDNLEVVVEAVLSDLKYGFGAVEAEGNLQQQIYALGYLEFADIYGIVDRIRIVIDQPRKGGLKEWVISKADLQEFGFWVAKRGGEAVHDPYFDAPVFRPSRKACQWCPLAVPGLCEARDEWIVRDLLEIEDLDDIRLAEPWAITPERRARLIEHTPTITSWLSDVAGASYGAAMRGEPDPGMKLVLGDEGDRTWRDSEAVKPILVGALGEAAYERKLLSFPQAEKVLKPGRKKPGHPEAWGKIKDEFTRQPARPVLVPASDKRPEYRPVQFDEMLDDDEV